MNKEENKRFFKLIRIINPEISDKQLLDMALYVNNGGDENKFKPKIELSDDMTYKDYLMWYAQEHNIEDYHQCDSERVWTGYMMEIVKIQALEIFDLKAGMHFPLFKYEESNMGWGEKSQKVFGLIR